MIVVNATNTANDKPKRHNSWLDFWEKYRQQEATYCRCCGAKNKKLVGGHVKPSQMSSYGITGMENNLFITPICETCNLSNEKPFKVDIDDLVSIKYNQ